jgi:hypothetical protein
MSDTQANSGEPQSPAPEENEPMLDVHVPHPTHTWKDFFIHIATICVGLLIAVSLEQTVEYFHHLHQRHGLEDELREDAEYDHLAVENNITVYDARLKWLLGLRKDVDTLLAAHGRADLPARVLTLPPAGHGLPGSGTLNIDTSAYESARDDGRLALLPEGERRGYAEVSLRNAQYHVNQETYEEAVSRAVSYADQFADIGTPLKPELSRMPEAQLPEYRALLTDEFGKLRTLRSTTVLFVGDLNVVLRGDFAEGDWLARGIKVEEEARAAYREDYAKMAAEIDAEDAARDKAAGKPAKKGAR